MAGAAGCFIVCITPRVSCTELVKAALDMAGKAERRLEILTVLPKIQQASERAAALVALDTISKNTGVDITIYYSDSPAEIIAEHARKNTAVQIVTGLPGEGSKGFSETLARSLPDIPVTTYTGRITYTMPPMGSLIAQPN